MRARAYTKPTPANRRQGPGIKTVARSCLFWGDLRLSCKVCKLTKHMSRSVLPYLFWRKGACCPGQVGGSFLEVHPSTKRKIR